MVKINFEIEQEKEVGRGERLRERRVLSQDRSVRARGCGTGEGRVYL